MDGKKRVESRLEAGKLVKFTTVNQMKNGDGPDEAIDSEILEKWSDLCAL